MIDNHSLLLICALLLLVFSFLKDNSLALATAVIIIAYETLKLKFWSDGAQFVHLSSDLFFIGLIATLVNFSKSWVSKGLFLFLGLLLIVGLHKTVFSTGHIIAEEAAPSHELFIQFKDKSSLKEWVKDNDNLYDITYPLFKVKDNSFQLDEYILVNLEAKAEVINSLIKSIERLSQVVDVEYNEQVNLEPLKGVVINNDYPTSINDPDLDKQWMQKPMNLNGFHSYMSKHKIQTQSTSLIAILDTGVEGNHEDLNDNYFSINKIYDQDERGHGTHCAGVAAAVTGNSIGIASLLPPDSAVKVTGIRVMNRFGLGTQKNIIDGIIEAADAGCSVISLSLGGPSSEERDVAYEEAIKYANAQGSIVVVSAGNSGADARDYTPASTPGVITVAALNSNMGIAEYSNDVSGLAMGLAAPGSDIYSTKPNNTYKSESGTSMAAPFVSGLIGLMKAYDSSLTTAEVYDIIRASSTLSEGTIVVNPQRAMELLFKRLN